jgi:hypothetical protein
VKARWEPDVSATSDGEGINVSDWDQVEDWAARPPAHEASDDASGRTQVIRAMRSPLAMTLAGGALLGALAWAVPSDGLVVTPGPAHPVTASPPATAHPAGSGEAEFNLTDPVNRQFAVEVTLSGKVLYTELDLSSGKETVLAQGSTNDKPGTPQATRNGAVMGLLPQDAYNPQPLLKPGKDVKLYLESTPVGVTRYQAYIAAFANPADAARFQGLLWTGAGGTLQGPDGPVPTADFPSPLLQLAGRPRVWAAPEYGAVGLAMGGEAVFVGPVTADHRFSAHQLTVPAPEGGVTMVYGFVPQGTVTKVALSDGRTLTTAVTTTPLPGTELAAFYGEATTPGDGEPTVQEVTWQDKAGHQHQRRVGAAAAK